MREQSSPQSPWASVRRKMLVSQAATLATVAGIATLIALVSNAQLGIDFIVGGLIALLPQLWFVVRSTGPTAGSHAGLLALGKLAISGAGFAVWFVIVPTANPVATLVGTATAIVVATLCMIGLQKRSVD